MDDKILTTNSIIYLIYFTKPNNPIGTATPRARAVDINIAIIEPVIPLAASPLIRSLTALVIIIPGTKAIIELIITTSILRGKNKFMIILSSDTKIP